MKKYSTHIVFSLAALQVSAAFANPTGLKPITTSELKELENKQLLKRIKKVKANKIGLSRINQERLRRGMDPLPESEATPVGRDTTVDTEATVGVTYADGSTDGFGGVLPSAVDNSTLQSFPPIGSQAWNSCAAWAMGYYQLTHNYNLAMGTSAKSYTSNRCSPKFIYNMINGGVDNGAYFSDALNMGVKHGCITWDKFPENTNYREWDLVTDHWQSALSMRSNAFQYVNAMDTATGLDQAKQLLNNGYVLTFGTYINSWQYTTIKSNPASASNPLAGQKVSHWMNGTNGGHAMTIVGYDDNAWVDINGNNVVDSGELGVFKIANSWGTTWGNSGYIFIAYDALKSISAVSGGPSSGRVSIFMSKYAYHAPVKASAGVAYKPKYLAKFTIRHGLRNQMSLKFGWSTTGNTAPTSTFTPFAMINKGGAYAFNGTTTAVDGTFIMDVSDLPITGSGDKLYMTMTDNTSGSAGTISSFQLIDVANGTTSAANLASPLVADASSVTTNLSYTAATGNKAPVASYSASTTTGTAPLAISFDASSSYDPDGTINGYSWNFGDGYTATGAMVSHTYSASGIYTATLTVTDGQGVSNSTSKTMTVSSSTSTSTTDTIAPTVTLTNPPNGARYARYSTVTATADASDNKGVSKVRFYVNGYSKCTDYSAPYTCSFSMPSGTSISVKARAYDAAGNYKTSNINYISN